MNSRRYFLRSLVASAGTPILLAGRAFAQAPPPGKLEESDPVAKALGFKSDTAQVDPKKYPQHAIDQKCSGCVLYQEKPGDSVGPCTSFGNKLVPAAGWCVAFAKKPATK